MYMCICVYIHIYIYIYIYTYTYISPGPMEKHGSSTVSYTRNILGWLETRLGQITLTYLNMA